MLKRSNVAIFFTMITVTDIMRKKLETIEKSDSVQEAAKKMADKNVSSLISQVSYLMSLYHLPNVLSRYSDTAVFCSSM
jgi:predicted transcriptional regulator